MSHTLRTVNLSNSVLAESVIIDYVQGGETYTLAELGIVTALQSIFFLLPATYFDDGTRNIIPRLSGGKIILEIGPGIEIASRVGINFKFAAVVHGT